MPRLCSVDVCGENQPNNKVLYDLQFIKASNGDYLLVASGDPGIVIYKWAHFEAAIDAALDESESSGSVLTPKKAKCQDPQPPIQQTGELKPISTFKPYPSPDMSFGGSVEINSTSYSRHGILYGAAGDSFGCYQWDLATETLLGTFGGASRFGNGGGGHRDYLHVVKAIANNEGTTQYVITGGEDGNMGMWDGKTRRLVEMWNIQSVMEKKKDLVVASYNTSSTSNNSRSFMTSSSLSTLPWNNGTNVWVSSMDTTNNGNWLAVCGGAENTNNNSLTSRSSSSPNTSGFMTLWHLPTRTFTSGCVTRESLSTVLYNDALDSFVSGGNEGRISFWDSTTMVRSGRSWCTPPATYTISCDKELNTMVVGGSGGILDCFLERVKVSQLQVTS